MWFWNAVLDIQEGLHRQQGFGWDQRVVVLGGLCSKYSHPIAQKASGNVEEGLGEWRHPFIFLPRPRKMVQI